jgi:hypothetical protein
MEVARFSLQVLVLLLFLAVRSKILWPLNFYWLAVAVAAVLVLALVVAVAVQAGFVLAQELLPNLLIRLPLALVVLAVLTVMFLAEMGQPVLL